MGDLPKLKNKDALNKPPTPIAEHELIDGEEDITHFSFSEERIEEILSGEGGPLTDEEIAEIEKTPKYQEFVKNLPPGMKSGDYIFKETGKSLEGLTGAAREKKIAEIKENFPKFQPIGDIAAKTFGKSVADALRGGLAGSLAMALNVLGLMWIRTVVNYQYRYGTGTIEAFTTLKNQGGIARFYRGLLPALLQGPLSRFGDTAANSGVLSMFDSLDPNKSVPIALRTGCASLAAAAWRTVLMPIDTAKTTMQVEGSFAPVVAKVKASGPIVLWHGALAAAAATFAGHYPWFFTYNFLNENLPKKPDALHTVLRSAFIGFSSSLISDTVSNSVRVVKVYRQASTVPVTYPNAIRNIIETDGMIGLFGRGLKTKILANGFQGLTFTVMWKYFENAFFKESK